MRNLYSVKPDIIGSGNGLVRAQGPVITWTNGDLLSFGPWELFTEVSKYIYRQEILFKLSFAQSFGVGLNVSNMFKYHNQYDARWCPGAQRAKASAGVEYRPILSVFIASLALEAVQIKTTKV